MGELHQAIIMLGGNVGDTICIFESAKRWLHRSSCRVTSQSMYYRSKPWAFEHQRDFINQLLVLETEMKVEGFHELCKSIEKKHGKMKLFVNGPRSLDIDILFFDDLILQTEPLTIPHPRLHLRLFNLVPLKEAVPDWVHPELKQTVSELCANCTDITPLKSIPLAHHVYRS